MLGERDTAVAVLNHLQTKIGEMDAANLAWMLNALRLAGVPKAQVPIPDALARLASKQGEDGRFPSTEGQDVHVTLEALRTMRHFV